MKNIEPFITFACLISEKHRETTNAEGEKQMEKDSKITYLVIKSQHGDESSIAELYKETYGLIYNICVGLLKNQEEAEDVLKDIYGSLYKNISDINDPKSFYEWLITIAVRKCLSKISAKKNLNGIYYDDVFQHAMYIEGDDNLDTLSTSYIMCEDKRRVVLDILYSQLSEVQYQTIFMYYFLNMSIRKIAAVMECSVNLVESRIILSHVKIKSCIKEYESTTKDIYTSGNLDVPFLSAFFNTYFSSIPVNYIPYSSIKALRMSSILPKVTGTNISAINNNTNRSTCGFVSKVFFASKLFTSAVASITICWSIATLILL